MNYAAGYSGKDAWLNKVDFFDVVVSGTVGAVTGPIGTTYRAGGQLGKVGLFIAKNPKLIKFGEVVTTSAIDITGEGWQDVSLKDFGKRAIVAGATHVAGKLIFGKPKVNNKVPKFEELTSSEMRQVVGAGDELTVQFGKGANQVSHAFRHTDALGLNRSLVKSSVQTHFKTVTSQVVAGKPFNQVINIGGQRIQYTAFKLPNGTFNIGRIHGVK